MNRYLSHSLVLGALVLPWLIPACGGQSEEPSFTDSSAAGSESMAGGDGGTVGTDGGSTSRAGNGTAGGSDAAGGAATVPPSEPPDIDVGQPDDTPVSDLDADEFDELCEQAEAAIGEITGETLAEITCRATALMVAFVLSGINPDDPSSTEDVSNEEFEQNCMDSYEQCITSGETPEQDPFDCQQPGPDCEATIEDVEMCLGDIETFKNRLDNSVPSCEGITVARALTAAVLLQGQGEFQSDACDRLEACDMSDSGMAGAGGAPGEP